MKENSKGINKIKGLDKVCLAELPSRRPTSVKSARDFNPRKEEALSVLTQLLKLWDVCADSKAQLPKLVKSQLEETNAAMRSWDSVSQ